jgi:zinc/manganese transport system permease protein
MNAFELSIIAPALAAGLLVLSTHVALGQEVLQRGIIFIDLAIAQVAGLGVIAADTMGWEPHGWRVQASAVSAALLIAVVLNWTGRHWKEIQEALIGAVFVLAASAGILILAGNPHGGEHLKELLVGQILWVTYEQLLPVALLYGLCLLAWFTIPQRLQGFGFYALFALVVTASVQLVGVYLVFASLIIPALATRHISSRNRRYLWGFLIGTGGYLLGLIASMQWDLPPGAVIAWGLAVFALGFSWLAPKRVRE